MTDMWWAGDRATRPPLLELIQTENRYVVIGLAAALAAGETIENDLNQMAILAYTYRTKEPIDPLALSAPLAYDPSTKTVRQKIDASKLPLQVPIVLGVKFRVNGLAGPETRSVWMALRVVA